MRRKSSALSNLGASKQSNEEWRKDYEEEMKKISQKKK